MVDSEWRMVKTLTTLLFLTARHLPFTTRQKSCYRTISGDVETLPENDRTRYTITPQARKELLTRLLKLNHHRAAEEQNATLAQAKSPSIRKTAKQAIIQLPPDDLDLFRSAPK